MKSVIRCLFAVCFVAYICGVKYKKPVLRYGGISAGELPFFKFAGKVCPFCFVGYSFGDLN